jgi:tRNA(adenine34) deaminase
MCAAALVHARVERLVFGAADPKTGAAGSLMNLVQDSRLNHQLTVTDAVLADEAALLLQDFFRARRGGG